jgi:small subunit ribosomal protein S6
MNHYETVFILTPVLSDAQVKESVEKYVSIITDLGGEVIQKEYWGLKKLAYPIQKKNTSFYNMIEYKAPSDAIAKLETQIKRDERIVRFLSIKMDKNHEAYAEKRRKKSVENA